MTLRAVPQAWLTDIMAHIFFSVHTKKPGIPTFEVQLSPNGASTTSTTSTTK